MQRGFLARFGPWCDLLVAALAVMILAKPASMFLDRELWLEERWLAQYRAARGVHKLFVDARGQTLPEPSYHHGPWASSLPPPMTARSFGDGSIVVAYSSSETDCWGRPWVAIVNPGEHYESFFHVLSTGPDGRFDWGRGDDIRMPSYFRWFIPRRMWAESRLRKHSVLAWLVVVPFTAIRCALATRSSRLWAEGLRAAGLAFAPASIGWLTVVRSELADEIPLDTRLLVVSPVVAVCATLSALLWGSAFAWRLHRPIPDGS